MPADQDWEGIRKRLDIMILLLLEQGHDPAVSVTRKIERLLAFGLTNSEVAQVIGKKINYVTAVTAGKRRSRGAKPARDKLAEDAGEPT